MLIYIEFETSWLYYYLISNAMQYSNTAMDITLLVMYDSK